MNYIAPRNITVASTCGRSVEFKKGVPTFAPPLMHDELTAFGIVPEEAMPEPEDIGGVKEPTDPTEREAALFAAFKRAALRAKREEFTASGVPHLAVLAMELGWAVPAKERDAQWIKFNQRTAEAA